MTVEPVDWIDETKKKDQRGKWRITERYVMCIDNRVRFIVSKFCFRFVYPAPKTSLESNVHPKQPHTSRIEELNMVGLKEFILSLAVINGPLAQSAERRADNAKVVSSRLTRTMFFFFTFFFPNGIYNQGSLSALLIERVTGQAG